MPVANADLGASVVKATAVTEFATKALLVTVSFVWFMDRVNMTTLFRTDFRFQASSTARRDADDGIINRSLDSCRNAGKSTQTSKPFYF